jgi:PmbA protein
MRDLLSIAHMACEVAKGEGAEFVDVVASIWRNVSVELDKGAIKSSDARWGSYVSVRAFIKGGMGASSISGSFEDDDVVLCARRAVEMARIAQPDPDFVSLPEPLPYKEVEGLYDPRIEAMEVSQLIDFLGMNVDEAISVCPEVVVNGGSSASFGESALVNSLGVEVRNKWTSIGLSISSVVKKGEDVGSYYEFDSARVLSDFVPQGIGRKATEGALSFLGARKVETKPMAVILGPLATHDLFSSICSCASAEEIQRNRSFLIGKRGEVIASELITVVDDGTYPRGIFSSPCDGEGFPRRPLTVIENGVLKSWLHNSYTANKAKEENTGHSTRGGISPTNVRILPGKVPSEEIIGSTDEGIYILSGSVSPNPITGEISATIDFGFKVERGRIAYPVKNAMIGINAIELMKKIDAVSSDYREEPGLIMPTIRAQNVLVAGGV